VIVRTYELKSVSGFNTADLFALLERESTTVDARNPNLQPFFGHGGKLIHYHGWSDQAYISARPPLNEAGPADAPMPVAGSPGMPASVLGGLLLTVLGLRADGHRTMLVAHPILALVILGTVFLCVTGGEALYADMGHFGRLPVRVAWFGIVWPGLLLNYFGQGALLLESTAPVAQPFYALISGTLLPLNS